MSKPVHLKDRHWLRILDLSEQMYEFANQQDWSMVQEIEVERQRRILQFFNSVAKQGLIKDMAESIRALLKSDQILLQSGIQARTKTSESLQTLSKGQKAVGAYAANTAGLDQ